MSEPISGSAAGAAAFKALGGPAAVAGGASALATIVAMVMVMVMTLPRNRGEWAVALISTVVASLCGGAALIQYLGLAAWMARQMGHANATIMLKTYARWMPEADQKAGSKAVERFASGWRFPSDSVQKTSENGGN